MTIKIFNSSSRKDKLYFNNNNNNNNNNLFYRKKIIYIIDQFILMYLKNIYNSIPLYTIFIASHTNTLNSE